MQVKNQNGELIANMAEWEAIVPKRQLGCGRSACALADFVLNKGGAEKICRVVSVVVGEPIHFDYATPECRIKFDDFGNFRHHDLGIYGKTEQGKSVFVGVEAKVGEEFGERIKAKFKRSSPTAKQRIKKLWERHALKPKIEESDIRYQLLYSTAGTVDAGADISVFLVMVFQTRCYCEKKGERNYLDYLHFMRETGAQRQDSSNETFDVHNLNLNGRPLICVYQKDVD